MKIEYAGAQLTIPDWLDTLWPYRMLLNDWPTFCGAGGGLGDTIVPDYIYGISIKHVCFIHDVEWATVQDSWKAFQGANNRFLKNLISTLLANLDGWKLVKAMTRAIGYWFVVSSPIGWANFSPAGQDWRENPVVKDKLHRLAMAVLARAKHYD